MEPIRIDLSPVRRTFEIPAPPDVEYVTDANGYRYQRSYANPGYWFNEDDAPVRGTYHWSDLLYQRGPVTADE